MTTETIVKVKIPRQFKTKTMFQLINDVLKHRPNNMHIEFDFTELKFIYPTGLTILSNLIEFLQLLECKVTFRITKPFSTGIEYLDDANFFKYYLGKNICENTNIRVGTTPLERIDSENCFSWLELFFRPWIINQSELTSPEISHIMIAMQEIFSNIRHHSTINTACIVSQYFPKQRSIILSISDFGIGIPSNIRKIKPKINDDEALILASIDGFTTKSHPGNGGAGLANIIKGITSYGQGEVRIYSCAGKLTCKNGIVCGEMSPGFYPGTLFEIKIFIDKMEQEQIENREEEFGW